MVDEEHINVAYKYCTASQTITNGPCHLIGVIVTPDGSNASYLDVYDGESSADDQFCRMRTASTSSRPFLFGEHVHLHKGIHVVFETNLESCTIFWHQIPK